MPTVTVTSYYRRSALQGVPGGTDGKEFACNARDLGSIPGLGRSSGKKNGYPVCYSCLENPNGQRNLAGYSPWGHQEMGITEQISTSESVSRSFVSGSC